MEMDDGKEKVSTLTRLKNWTLRSAENVSSIISVATPSELAGASNGAPKARTSKKKSSRYKPVILENKMPPADEELNVESIDLPALQAGTELFLICIS